GRLSGGEARLSGGAGQGTLARSWQRRGAGRTEAERLAVVEDYVLRIARQLVSGCDVWVNLPRRPMEASGTSGMKATFNGALQLSVLDGWWAEAFDGTNGWALPLHDEPDLARGDALDAEAFYELLDHEVIPLFYERCVDGV